MYVYIYILHVYTYITCYICIRNTSCVIHVHADAVDMHAFMDTECVIADTNYLD